MTDFMQCVVFKPISGKYFLKCLLEIFHLVLNNGMFYGCMKVNGKILNDRDNLGYWDRLI